MQFPIIPDDLPAIETLDREKLKRYAQERFAGTFIGIRYEGIIPSYHVFSMVERRDPALLGISHYILVNGDRYVCIVFVGYGGYSSSYWKEMDKSVHPRVRRFRIMFDNWSQE